VHKYRIAQPHSCFNCHIFEIGQGLVALARRLSGLYIDGMTPEPNRPLIDSVAGEVDAQRKGCTASSKVCAWKHGGAKSMDARG